MSTNNGDAVNNEKPERSQPVNDLNSLQLVSIPISKSTPKPIRMHGRFLRKASTSQSSRLTQVTALASPRARIAGAVAS